MELEAAVENSDLENLQSMEPDTTVSWASGTEGTIENPCLFVSSVARTTSLSRLSQNFVTSYRCCFHCGNSWTTADKSSQNKCDYIRGDITIPLWSTREGNETSNEILPMDNGAHKRMIPSIYGALVDVRYKFVTFSQLAATEVAYGYKTKVICVVLCHFESLETNDYS